MRKGMARRGSLLLSVLAVVLSAALIAGATYALFSQRDSYDIEVSSGDIKVTGELAITGAWSQGENAAARTEGTEQEDGSYLVEQGGVFRTDGSKIVMANISQGDGATFRLTLTNESSVSMQYRVYIKAEESNALTEALELKADGAEITLEGGTATLVGWTQVDAGAALADGETEVEISLPWGNDDAAGQVANLNVVVEAVQANAVAYDFVSTDDTASVASTESGAAVSFGYGTETAEPVTVDGHGTTNITKWQDLWIKDDITIRGVTFLQGVTISVNNASEPITITVENCTVHACNQELLKTGYQRIDNSGDGLCLNIETMGNAVTVIVKDCKFVGENDNTLDRNGYNSLDNLLGTNGNNLGRWKSRGYGLALGAIAGNTEGLVSAEISGCTFTGIRGNALQLYSIGCAVTVEDCTFESWGCNWQTSSKVKSDAAIRGDLKEGGSLTLAGNTYVLEEDDGENGIKQVNVDGYSGPAA